MGLKYNIIILLLVKTLLVSCRYDTHTPMQIEGLYVVEIDSLKVLGENMFVEFTDSTIQFYQDKVGYLPADHYKIKGEGDTLLAWSSSDEDKSSTNLGRIIGFSDSTILILNSTRQLKLTKITKTDFLSIMGRDWHE